MKRTRPGCSKANTDLAGELGVASGHKGRHLLMSYPHIVKAIFCSAQSAHDAVNAIAGITENPLNAPVTQTLQHEVCNRVCHHCSPRLMAVGAGLACASAWTCCSARAALPARFRPRFPSGQSVGVVIEICIWDG